LGGKKRGDDGGKERNVIQLFRAVLESRKRSLGKENGRNIEARSRPRTGSEAGQDLFGHPSGVVSGDASAESNEQDVKRKNGSPSKKDVRGQRQAGVD